MARGPKNPIVRVLCLLALALCGTYIVRNYGLEAISIATPSMSPTLDVGTHYLVNRFVYHLHAPQRGDIISFVSPVDEDTLLVKRVIAIEGDTIELRDKKVILNKQPLEEPYALYKRAKEHLDGDTIPEITVPAGKVFVLGDNRDESFDSTAWLDKAGNHLYFLPLDHIRGRLMQLV